MPEILHRARAALTTAEVDRQVRRLYYLAYRVEPIGQMLANPQANAATVAYAMARIPRALSAARRLLALPGVAGHEETAYARSLLNAAEQQLNAPTTRLLIIANAAREAAAQADAADDDVRVVVFRDIEERCRYLVDAARVEPVLARRGWSGHDRAASDRLQQWAARWGLGADDDGPAQEAGAVHPEVDAELVRQAAERAATRARCAAGIRCTETGCLTYGAIKVTLPGAWLCASCIAVVNARLAARGYAPDTVRPLEGGIPDDARYIVTLYNASGRGACTIECDTPQRAQFIAETERPFNNTGYEIEVPAPPRN
ncbi:hypothetical protein [Streptomyces sp. 7N604]|uniref:hypothetical protein n=1 Tax=Streptomyces sp. 7N604 TaxID=3457415 RepID=UPI003FD4F748